MLMVNVGKYTSPMDGMGISTTMFFWFPETGGKVGEKWGWPTLAGSGTKLEEEKWNLWIFEGMVSLPKTNSEFAPENGWFPIGIFLKTRGLFIFRGYFFDFREGHISFENGWLEF